MAWSMGTEPKVRILWALLFLSPESLCLPAGQFDCSSVFCNSRKAGRGELGVGHENQMVKISIREAMTSVIGHKFYVPNLRGFLASWRDSGRASSLHSSQLQWPGVVLKPAAPAFVKQMQGT